MTTDSSVSYIAYASWCPGPTARGGSGSDTRRLSGVPARKCHDHRAETASPPVVGESSAPAASMGPCSSRLTGRSGSRGRPTATRPSWCALVSARARSSPSTPGASRTRPCSTGRWRDCAWRCGQRYPGAFDLVTHEPAGRPWSVVVTFHPPMGTPRPDHLSQRLDAGRSGGRAIGFVGSCPRVVSVHHGAGHAVTHARGVGHWSSRAIGCAGVLVTPDHPDMPARVSVLMLPARGGRRGCPSRATRPLSPATWTTRHLGRHRRRSGRSRTVGGDVRRARYASPLASSYSRPASPSTHAPPDHWCPAVTTLVRHVLPPGTGRCLQARTLPPGTRCSTLRSPRSTRCWSHREVRRVPSPGTSRHPDGRRAARARVLVARGADVARVGPEQAAHRGDARHRPARGHAGCVRPGPG